MQIEDGGGYAAEGQDVIHIRQEDGFPFKADYHVSQAEIRAAFLLDGRKDVTLDFGGATLMLHGKLQPFALRNCENVTIRNVVVRNDRAAFTEFTIVDLGADWLKVRLNPHHPCRVEDGTLIPYGEYWENRSLDRTSMFMQSFDAETRDGLGMPLCIIGKTVHRDPKFPFTVDQYVAEQDGEFIVLHGKVHECFKVGCTVAIGHESRVYSNVLIKSCRNVHLENVRFLNGCGMGILAIHSHDIFLDRLQYKYDELSEGIITNHADAIHTFACSGRFDITDSFFEGMIDDALNIHSQFYLLESCSGDRMVLRCDIPGATSACTVFDVGDVIAVHRGKTTAIDATYTIRTMRILDKNRIEVILDRTSDVHETESLVENMSGQADITIRRSVFRNANSHLRFQSGGKIRIEDCEIGLPVLLTGDASYWYESSGIRDMEFRNTVFTKEKASVRICPEIMPSEEEPYYHKNIRFENCRFRSVTPLVASYADNILLRNCSQEDGKPITLKLLNCGTVDAPGCALERRTEVKTKMHLN